jgi:DNA-binding NtrC family response regulator
MEKILYVDDEPNNLLTLEISIGQWYKVITLDSPIEALNTIKTENIKVLITDQRMPHQTGLELAKKVQENFPHVVVIILTAFDDNETMLKAISQGGIFRYLLKPWDLNDLKQTLDSAFETYSLRRKNNILLNDLLTQNKKLQVAYNQIINLKDKLEEENILLKNEIIGSTLTPEIIGGSKVMRLVLLQLQQAAKTNSTVLLLGETGTGKELFAKTLHSLSSRKNNLLVNINCAAIPETLIESELFGHEKGAFTGADKLKLGKVEIANNGSLFLDEIGELPLNMQPKLLRVLQESDFERIGGNKTIKVDFRLIAATNRNLEVEIHKGTFRSDLFYRINIIPITIPPLRDHIDDIPLLTEHFILKLNKKSGKIINSVPKKTIEKLMEYHWPGNIRELENIIERGHVLSNGNKLEIGNWFSSKPNIVSQQNEFVSIDEHERIYLLKVLKATKWKIRGANGAAEILNINPTTLESRLKKLNISRPI